MLLHSHTIHLHYILNVHTFLIYKYPMKSISLKIDDSIFGETEEILSKISMPRNRYINEALDYYNKVQKRKLLEKRLKVQSEFVSRESMKVLKDFEDIDYAEESV